MLKSLSKAWSNSGSLHGHVRSKTSLPCLYEGGKVGLFECTTTGWTGDAVGLLMPVNVYVFLVTIAGLLTTGSQLGSAAGLEGLGCRTGPVFLVNVSGLESLGSNAEFETFGNDTGSDIFGTGLDSLGSGTGLALLGTVSEPGLFGIVMELGASGAGTRLMPLGIGLGLFGVSTGVKGLDTVVEPSSVLIDWQGDFIVWDTLKLFTCETSETTLLPSSTVCNSEYWKLLDDVTSTEELLDLSAEQPSSSMWSSKGREVQMEATAVFSKALLGSVDGIVGAWSTGKLENSTESWLTDNWEPDWMVCIM